MASIDFKCTDDKIVSIPAYLTRFDQNKEDEPYETKYTPSIIEAIEIFVDESTVEFEKAVSENTLDPLEFYEAIRDLGSTYALKAIRNHWLHCLTYDTLMPKEYVRSDAKHSSARGSFMSGITQSGALVVYMPNSLPSSCAFKLFELTNARVIFLYKAYETLEETYEHVIGNTSRTYTVRMNAILFDLRAMLFSSFLLSQGAKDLFSRIIDDDNNGLSLKTTKAILSVYLKSKST